jgi:outer membrane biosynthesis protein TonB
VAASKTPAKTAKPKAKSAPKAAKPSKAAKSAPKVAAKPAKSPADPAEPPSKPAEKGAGERKAPPIARGNGPAAAAAKGTDQEPAPAPAVEQLAEGVLCQIEVLKDGHFFIARTQTDSGQAKEFKNTVFEDLLTEMLITLQEQLAD